MAIGTGLAILGGGLLGAWSANKSAKDTNAANKQMQQESIAAQKEATKIDPRIESMLYGSGKTTQTLKQGAIPHAEKIDGVTRMVYDPSDYETSTDSGLLGKGMDYLNKPQSNALQSVGRAAESSLINNYANDQAKAREGIDRLMTGQTAPQMDAAQTGLLGSMQAARMEAPKPFDAAQGSLTTASPVGKYDVAQAQAAQVGAPQSVAAGAINAPSQNTLDLKNAYNEMIYGDPGRNPFLIGAIQKGINQSRNAFGDLIQDGSQAVQDALGSIRGGAIASGQYGGSRQGLAEARTIGDLSKNLTRAAERFGQGTTDSAVAAQAGQYNQDIGNRLSAMTSLSGQQYGVASQNAQLGQQAALANAQMAQQAQMQNAQNQQQTSMFNAGNQTGANQAQFGANQQTNLANMGAANDMSRFNATNQQATNQQAYGGLLSANQQNAQNQQNANQTNYSGNLQNAQFNAGNVQQANQANLGAKMNTNQMNNAGLLGGLNALGGMSANDYNMANQFQNADFNKVQQVSGLLQPYAGKGSPINVPQFQSVTSNPLGGAIGGATTGMALYNAFNQPSNTGNGSMANWGMRSY